MKKFWQIIGGVYMFFRREKWIASLLLAIAVIIQFVLLLLLTINVCSLGNEFKENHESISNRVNQIYSQVFILNTRMNQILEKK